MAAKPSLTIKRRFNAPPAKVFAAWTDPEKVKRWMGPGEVKVLSAENDARTGGRYRWVMHAPDGEHHEVGGVYREVVPNERLVFSWAWHSTPERESQVTVTFKARRRRYADDDGSRAVLRRIRARPPSPRRVGPARWVKRWNNTGPEYVSTCRTEFLLER